jgi:hypothetical protein
LIVDAYMDADVLTKFCVTAPEGIPIRLLADAASVKPGLAPATHAWVAQYGAARPLEARLARRRALHDRAIFVDHSTAWILTQSFNDVVGPDDRAG